MIVLKSKPAIHQDSDVEGIGQLVCWLFKTSNIVLVQQFALLKSFTQIFLAPVSQCFAALLAYGSASNNYFWNSIYFILESFVKLSCLGGKSARGFMTGLDIS
jgi:hypothetical protein